MKASTKDPHCEDLGQTLINQPETPLPESIPGGLKQNGRLQALLSQGWQPDIWEMLELYGYLAQGSQPGYVPGQL